MSIRLVTLIAFFASLTMASASASAESVNVTWRTKDGVVLKEQTIDLAGLEKMPQHDIITGTPWTEGKQTFSGPTLAEVADLGGEPVAEAQLTALNDYTISIPAADWKAYPIILATRTDGNTMRVRDNGPFWVIYPLDDHPDINNQFYHARMIWQVRDIAFIID